MSKYKEYKRIRLTNLYETLINEKPVLNHYFQAIGELMEYYNIVLDEKFGTSAEFKSSMKRSINSYNYPQLLEEALGRLKSDVPDSFLIVPIFEKIHTSAAVVKRQKDGYKLYLVDKFLCNGLSILPDRAYCKEYSIKHGKENDLMRELKKSFFSGKYTLISEVLSKYSESRHILKITSRKQKMASCSYKEPEAAIKFAFATRDLSTERIRELRTANDFSKSFKVKWGSDRNATADVHRRLAEVIKRKNPDVDLDNLDGLYDVHFKNKLFRRLVKSGTPIKTALQKAFDPDGHLSFMTSEEQLKSLLLKINWDTAKQIPELKDIILTVYGRNTLEEYRRCLFDITYVGEGLNLFVRNSFNGLKENFKNVEKNFPILGKQARSVYTNAYLIIACSRFDMALEKANGKARKVSVKTIDSSLNDVRRARTFCPNLHLAYYLEGILRLAKGYNIITAGLGGAASEFASARDCFEKTLELNPRFGEAYYGKSLAYEKLGDHNNSLVCFELARKNGLEIIRDNALRNTNPNSFYESKTLVNCIPDEIKEDLLRIKKDMIKKPDWLEVGR